MLLAADGFLATSLSLPVPGIRSAQHGKGDEAMDQPLDASFAYGRARVTWENLHVLARPVESTLCGQGIGCQPLCDTTRAFDKKWWIYSYSSYLGEVAGAA